ncbi:hypothetical protein V6N13_060192 [Hibiscus sabdariffa]
MASNLRVKTAIISKALTRPRPAGAFYAVSNQSLPPKHCHWIKRKDQNGQDGFFSFQELSLSALELGRFSEDKCVGL